MFTYVHLFQRYITSFQSKEVNIGEHRKTRCTKGKWRLFMFTSGLPTFLGRFYNKVCNLRAYAHAQ